MNEKDAGRYRKRPVVIDAIRWMGDNAVQVDSFIASKGLSLQVHMPKSNSAPIRIDTIDGGTVQAEVGDWLLVGVKGEPYPCKDDIFKATYEPA